MDNIDFTIPLISSVKFLLQVDWWNDQRSIIPILSDLLLLPENQRYSVNSSEATELWCQVIVQFDHINGILSAIKNNVVCIDLPCSEKTLLVEVLNENVKAASNMLFFLEQKNFLFAGLCTKITLTAKLLHMPEYLFSIHPNLFYSLMNNEFTYGHDPKPSIEFLLQNLPEMREFLLNAFSSDLFKITDITWDEHWEQYQKLDWSLIDTAECLVKDVELDVVLDNYVDILRDRFDIIYKEKLDLF